MRYAFAVTPVNYLLFGCHFVNFGAQLTQGYRFVNHWYLGGRDAMASKQVKDGVEKMEGVVGQVEGKVKGAIQEVKEKVGR